MIAETRSMQMSFIQIKNYKQKLITLDLFKGTWIKSLCIHFMKFLMHDNVLISFGIQLKHEQLFFSKDRHWSFN